MKFGIVSIVVFVAAYVATIALYAGTGLGRPSQITDTQPMADGTTVVIDLEELHAMRGELVANLTVSPGPELLDPITHNLKDDLAVAVTSAVTNTKRSWSKGMVPGVFPVALTISGDPAEYPFDRYRSAPVTVELFHGATQLPVRAPATFVDRLSGWKVSVPNAGSGGTPAPYRVTVQRSPSTAAFAAIVLGLMVVIAAVGVFVAVATARGRRKFQPPMTTWYAAMLFAVVPLRNALPDAPAMGFWIDVTVVLWVLVALVAAMVLYISCWWRHLKPEVEAPPDPAPETPVVQGNSAVM
jgi:Domain of unknown function (DUF4436)